MSWMSKPLSKVANIGYWNCFEVFQKMEKDNGFFIYTIPVEYKGYIKLTYQIQTIHEKYGPEHFGESESKKVYKYKDGRYIFFKDEKIKLPEEAEEIIDWIEKKLSNVMASIIDYFVVDEYDEIKYNSKMKNKDREKKIMEKFPEHSEELFEYLKVETEKHDKKLLENLKLKVEYLKDIDPNRLSELAKKRYDCNTFEDLIEINLG